MGLVPAKGDFLEFLREAADRSGALLVFDEVISGFRVARGGAQELVGVTPDLTILGKIIGGGLPAAAYPGPAELMQRVAPAGAGRGPDSRPGSPRWRTRTRTWSARSRPRGRRSRSCERAGPAGRRSG